MRFRFELRPPDEVEPWDGDPPMLHWFGLTDGWYWIEVGEYDLLRRTGVEDPRPYIDYQVARLWEDVNLVSPAALEPVPDDLLTFIASDSESWVYNWLQDVAVRDQGADHNVPEHPSVVAALWHGEHNLDFSYLLNPPRLRLWRSIRGGNDEVTVDWQHKDDGRISFAAGAAVRCSIPTTEYLDAVRTFDREFLAAMRQRIEELEDRGGIPGVEIDLPGLRHQQDQRTRWLTRNLDRRLNTDWNAVRKGAGILLGTDSHA
ncbi:DUF5984 family protein [Actinoplanes sp. NPDC023801]|uniref:DUF5984 family protein n=1 Tax=Actinoplanes sp. NPDC023801 TaxID=3154595 RepID=UPI0033E35521